MRIRTLILALLPLSAMGGEWVLENDYFRVSRDAVQCAQADARACIDRVIVALAALDLDCGSGLRQLARGDVAVFGDGESYLQPLGGSDRKSTRLNSSHRH